MSEEINELIMSNKKFLASIQELVKKQNESLEAKAEIFEKASDESLTNLERALHGVGITDIDMDLFLEYEGDTLLKLKRDKSLLIFVPIGRPKLLVRIGDVGNLISKFGNYLAFEFDEHTDPRYGFPEEIEEDVLRYLPDGFEKDMAIKDGMLVFKPETKDKVKQKYGKFLTNIQQSTATIKPKTFLDFITYLGMNGYYLYHAGSYPKKLLRKIVVPSKIRMEKDVLVKTDKGMRKMDFTYQKDIVEQLKDYRHATIACKTGSGKTIMTLAFCCKLTGIKLVLVDRDTARSQWKKDIATWAPELRDEIIVETYQMLNHAMKGKKNALYKKIEKTPLSLIVYDEGERAFSEEWSVSLGLKSEGRLFLTATPFPRNIKDLLARRNLFGRTFATNWRETMLAQQKTFAKIRVNILKNEKEKLARLLDSVNNRRDTNQLVFAHWKTPREGITTGFEISKKINKLLTRQVKFIHGQTRGDKLELLHISLSEQKIIVSNLASRSLSFKRLQTVHLFNPMASESLPVQQIGRFGHSWTKNKLAEIYFILKEITKPEAQDWMAFLMSKGYDLVFPDGKPKFEKRSTMIEEVVGEIIAEKKTVDKKLVEKEPTKFKEEPVEVHITASSAEIEEFFNNELIKERIRAMFLKTMPQPALTKKILGLYLLLAKSSLSRDEIIRETNTSEKSLSNVSKGINNLEDQGLIIKDTSSKPIMVHLNLKAAKKFAEEKKREKKLKAATSKLDKIIGV